MDYIVGEGDVIKITVYEHPDFTATARVSSDGMILFPFLGQLKVGNMTISQISKKITDLLSDDYIINPQVAVFVVEFDPFISKRATIMKTATIMGQIIKPGIYELSGNTSLLEF